MRADFIVVSTPILHFRAGVVKAHEPVSVQAFGSELAIERLKEGVVSGLSRAGEVEHHVLLIRPEIKVAGDKLRALVDPDRLRISYFPAEPHLHLGS